MSDGLVKMCKRLSKHAHAQLSSADLDRIANRIDGLETALATARRDALEECHAIATEALTGDADGRDIYARIDALIAQEEPKT